MAPRSPVDDLEGGPLTEQTRSELGRLSAVQSVEGQIALALAGALDDRAGIQAGGLASTAKELRSLIAEIREKNQPKGKSKLELLRGGADAG